jgi:hypothetical protein
MGTLDVFAKQWKIDKFTSMADLEAHYPNVPLAADLSNLRNLANTHLIADVNYHAPAFHTARCLSSVPNRETGRTIPVYLYRVDALAAVLYKGREYLGYLHTGEIPFVLATDYLWQAGDDDSKTSDVMSRAWITFANSGSPGPSPRNVTSLALLTRVLRTGEGYPRYTGQDSDFTVFQPAGKTAKLPTSEWRKAQREYIGSLIQQRSDELDGEAGSAA